MRDHYHRKNRYSSNWSKSTIYVKPFPRYLGDHEFWTAHLCELKELHEIAGGFVFSYTWLISFESDFDIALELNLIPPMLWTQWRAYIQGVRRTIDVGTLSWINRRYLYGELRLHRLNWTYRFNGRPRNKSLLRSYFLAIVPIIHSSHRISHGFSSSSFL